VDVESAAADDRPLARALARLERKGLVIYSGFTPTDAAHVLGISSHWSTTAAELGARIWARQMRRLYGLGTWPDGDVEGPARQIFDLVIDGISQKLVEAGLHEQNRLAAAQADKLARLLTEMAMEQRRDPSKPSVFSIQFATDTPVVAVGGPAASYYPEVARGLRVGLYMPRFAEVANAVGAVLGEVSQRVHLTITQPVRGTFRVFADNGPKDFQQLESAVAHARELAAVEATALARQAGAASVQVEFAQDENTVSNEIDGDVFFEMRLTAIASGPPRHRASNADQLACAVC
jgi:N-methylhydantoinase A/oxoprolinase/acetone carboxylase beta subunit